MVEQTGDLSADRSRADERMVALRAGLERFRQRREERQRLGHGGGARRPGRLVFVSFTGESPQDASATPTTSASASLVARDSVQTDIDSSGATSGLPTVALRDLPSEAQQAHRLILTADPYPYPQDDGVFGNREQNLPGRSTAGTGSTPS